MTCNALQDFARSEDGAITVDWVVLTAAVSGLGLATALVVIGGIENLANDTDAELMSMDADNAFDP